ncbi:MAG: ATP-binding protein [Bryobacteraceae bacterium]|jgi:signal transduction histidine kinase
MNKPLCVLQVEDSEPDAELLVRILGGAGYEVDSERVENAGDMRRALAERAWDVIIADYRLPRFSAPAALEVLRETGQDIPFIVVSGAVGEDVAVETMRLGAHDYLLKNSLTRLAAAVEREIGNARMRRQQREREERLVKELERSNADLQAYAYTVSHDLREPLRMVSCYVDLIERRCGSRLDEESREFMDIVTASVQRMSDMLRGLLEFSRAGQGRLTMSAIDGHVLINEVIDSLSLEIRDTGARISVGPLPVLLAWEGRLQHVFQNLIGNALKYRHPRQTPRIAISAQRRGEEWLFAVEDNGIGFAMEHAERIFGVFQRLDPGERQGTGIGLAISRRIVERHGGRIWAESAPGRGATFYFTIPSPVLPGAIAEDELFFREDIADRLALVRDKAGSGEPAPVPVGA